MEDERSDLNVTPFYLLLIIHALARAPSGPSCAIREAVRHKQSRHSVQRKEQQLEWIWWVFQFDSSLGCLADVFEAGSDQRFMTQPNLFRTLQRRVAAAWTDPSRLDCRWLMEFSVAQLIKSPLVLERNAWNQCDQRRLLSFSPTFCFKVQRFTFQKLYCPLMQEMCLLLLDGS